MACRDASSRASLAILALVAGSAVSGAGAEAESFSAYSDDPQLQAEDGWGGFSHLDYYHPGLYRRWHHHWMAGPAGVPLDETSEAGSSGVRLRVRSNFSEPVLLASSCLKNQTLLAGEEAEVSVLAGSALWVVPKSARWDCLLGCADCFYVATATSSTGNMSAAVGFGAWQEDDEETDYEMEMMLAEGGVDAMDDFAESLQRERGGASITAVKLSAEQGADGHAAGCPQGLCNANQISVKQGSLIGVVIQGLGASGDAAKLRAGSGWWGGYHPIHGHPAYNPMHPAHGHPAYNPWHPLHGHPAFNPMHPAHGHPAYNPAHPIHRWR